MRTTICLLLTFLSVLCIAAAPGHETWPQGIPCGVCNASVPFGYTVELTTAGMQENPAACTTEVVANGTCEITEWSYPDCVPMTPCIFRASYEVGNLAGVQFIDNANPTNQSVQVGGVEGIAAAQNFGVTCGSSSWKDVKFGVPQANGEILLLMTLRYTGSCMDCPLGF